MSFGPRWESLLRASPIFARELRQTGRSGGVLALVFFLALLLGLAMFGISSALGIFRDSIQVGPLLFQVFFSLVYFGVTLFAPALAATGLASEKERRTWEALRLTAMDPKAMVQGKMWSALTSVGVFLVLTLPASVLCMLPGGVKLSEVFFGYVLLAIIAVVSVSFGLSIGAWAETAAQASMVALAASLFAAPVLYFAIGVGLSFFAHATWARVPSGSPVWLPLAYGRAHFDGWYLLLLMVIPSGVASLSSWFSLELARSRLAGQSDDRTRGLKLWFLVTAPIAFAIATVPGFMTRGEPRGMAWIGGLGGLFFFLAFAAFVFAGDDLEASRRVEFRWRKQGASWFDRFLGPGLVQTSLTVLVTSLLLLGLFCLTGAAALAGDERRFFPPPTEAVSLLASGQSWSAFLVFLTGFLMWSRLRSGTSGTARGLAVVVSGTALLAPFIVYTLFGFAVGKRFDALLLASPSPLYAFVMIHAIEKGEPHLPLTSGLACSIGWMALGLTLLGLGARRATKKIAERRTARAALDAVLAREDAAIGGE